MMVLRRLYLVRGRPPQSFPPWVCRAAAWWSAWGRRPGWSRPSSWGRGRWCCCSGSTPAWAPSPGSATQTAAPVTHVQTLTNMTHVMWLDSWVRHSNSRTWHTRTNTHKHDSCNVDRLLVRHSNSRTCHTRTNTHKHDSCNVDRRLGPPLKQPHLTHTYKQSNSRTWHTRTNSQTAVPDTRTNTHKHDSCNMDRLLGPPLKQPHLTHTYNHSQTWLM